MNNEQTQGVFRALSDPTRREILKLLSNDELTIAEVAEQFEISRGAVKKHLQILEEGELIHVYQRGRERVNQLQPASLKAASEWLSYFSQFWDTKLTALHDAIQQHKDS